MQSEQSTSGSAAYGEVYDLGYRHFEGERAGRGASILALILYSIKRGLGIKKRWTAKIAPILLHIGAFTPAIIAAGIMAFVRTDEEIFSYGDLNEFISVILFVWAGALGPAMLCDDRRENVLGLYFSRPITRSDYLLAKIGAMGILMSTIALGPGVLLFLANVLLADSPLSYFGDHIDDLGRIIAAGGLTAIYLSAIALAIAAYTNRTGVATAIFIAGLTVLMGIANALYEVLDGTAASYVIFLSIGDLTQAFGEWVLGERTTLAIAELQGGTYAVGMIITAAIAGAIMYRRYQVDT